MAANNAIGLKELKEKFYTERSKVFHFHTETAGKGFPF